MIHRNPPSGERRNIGHVTTMVTAIPGAARFRVVVLTLLVLQVVVFGLPFCGLPPGSAQAARTGAGGAAPFQPGETLTYELRWEVVPAGYASLKVLPMETVNGVKSYHFVMTAESNSFIDTFYKVRDRVDAYADADMTHSILYKQKQHEGKRKRDITVTFDWANSRAEYSNYGKKREPIEVPSNTFDPLSVFYAFRFNDLKVGDEMTANVSDGKKLKEGKARVVSRETIEVGGVKYDTFLVEPDLKNIGGVFEKSKDARLQIWVTADGKSVPVRIRSKVSVGNFIAELVSRSG